MRSSNIEWNVPAGAAIAERRLKLVVSTFARLLAIDACFSARKARPRTSAVSP